MARTFFLLTVSALILLINSTESKNLIINNNFSQNTCRQAWCTSSSKTLVPSWVPDPLIEIGKGTFYSDFLGN
jgi:hypothetical protein